MLRTFMQTILAQTPSRIISNSKSSSSDLIQTAPFRPLLPAGFASSLLPQDDKEYLFRS